MKAIKMGRYLVTTAGVLILASAAWAQGGRGGQAPAAPRTPKAAAPVDITGYWVTVVTEDWPFRMVTPRKGDYAGVPLNAEGRKVADQWDPSKDVSSGEQCRAFGAGGIMRMPVRLHITWQDENTLKVDIDNGTQTRLFRFDKNAQAPAQPEWQGFSIASWETVPEGQGIAPNAGGRGGPAEPPMSGALKVTTTHMKPGYMRRNGVMYSGNAKLTEFFDRTNEKNGDSWLILTSVLDDPQNLQLPFMLSTHFKKEADGSKFSPRPCQVVLPDGKVL
jgi:hypothetical protein